MISFGNGPQKGRDEVRLYHFQWGNKKMASIGADDIGKCAYGIFQNENEVYL